MAQIIGPVHVMGGSVATYNFIPPDYLLYTWTADGGNILSGQDTPTVTVLWLRAGQCSLSISYGNAEALRDEVVINVDVNTQGG